MVPLFPCRPLRRSDAVYRPAMNSDDPCGASPVSSCSGDGASRLAGTDDVTDGCEVRTFSLSDGAATDFSLFKRRGKCVARVGGPVDFLAGRSCPFLSVSSTKAPVPNRVKAAVGIHFHFSWAGTPSFVHGPCTAALSVGCRPRTVTPSFGRGPRAAVASFVRGPEDELDAVDTRSLEA